MKLYEIKEILKADVLTGESFMEETIVGGGAADLMEDILSAAAEGAVLLTGLTTDQVLRTARISGVRAVVFVRGKRPEEKLIQQAADLGIPLLLTEDSLFVACGRLYMNGLRGLDGSW